MRLKQPTWRTRAKTQADVDAMLRTIVEDARLREAAALRAYLELIETRLDQFVAKARVVVHTEVPLKVIKSDIRRLQEAVLESYTAAQLDTLRSWLRPAVQASAPSSDSRQWLSVAQELRTLTAKLGLGPRWEAKPR